MTNEVKRVFHGTTTTLEANGASIVNNAIAQADDASLDLGAYTSPADYPNVRFVASFTFAVSPTENTSIELVARELDIDSTNDAQAPEATFRHKSLGNFPVNNVTSAQYAALDVYECPRKADYYLYNNATGQSISSGWTLKATPFTHGPV